MLDILALIGLVIGSVLVLIIAFRLAMWVARSQLTCRACGTYLKSYEAAFCTPCDKAERLLEFRYEQHANDELRRAANLWADRDYTPDG